MIEKFEQARMRKGTLSKLEQINSIIKEYVKDDYKLTLRQLYYQLVSRDIIPNDVKEYDRLSTLLTKGRMVGIVDWDAIEDRLRVPYIPYWVTGTKDAINEAISRYRLDRQRGQDVYIEVWVEKDALSGVLRRVTEHYHINLMVNRGYGSTTAMYDAYRRYMGKNVKILYLGDHDPSGLDMIRDIGERISYMLDGDFTIEPVALTMEQIREYNLPENPAKETDTRAKDYIEKWGHSSWEVDALNPQTLNNLVSFNIESSIDMELFHSIIEQEKADKIKLSNLIEYE